MLTAALVAWLALLAPSRPVQDSHPSSSLLDALPGDAVFVMAVEDFATLWERAQETAWAELARDPALEGLRERLDASLQGELGRDGPALVSALDLVRGAAFFAGSREREDMQSKGLVLRLRSGSPEVVRALRARMQGPAEAVQLDGRSYFAGRGGYSRSWEVLFSWSEGIAVVDARERENALRLAATLAEALDSRAASSGAPSGEPCAPPAARRSLRRPPNRATLEAYLDVGSLLTSSVNPRQEQEREIVAALDLHDFGWAAVQLTLGEGARVELEASLELPRAGPWPLLAARMRPAPTRLAQLAPADAIEVSVLGFDVQEGWRDFRSWLAQELPDVARDLERSLGDAARSTGIDPEQDLLRPLSGELARFLLPLAADEQTPPSGVVVGLLLGLIGSRGSHAGSVYLLGVEDVVRVGGTIDELIELSDARGQVREEVVAGRRMWSFDVPELKLRPSWAFCEDALVVSVYQSGVRSVLQQASDTPPRPWLDAKRRAALRAGGAVFGSSVADLAGLIRARWVAPLAILSDTMGYASAPTRAADPGHPLPASPGEIVDALPALVEEYLSGSARTTVAVDGRTLRYRFWTH